ncbi:hypothetical protein [Rhizobium leguminosarum]|uniref:hypothetical protein n=1 Tax=Rhizobium leguminosarum TaxID=384 RepID=UPI00103CBA30|nr:hypothetical protein [Rhizobium leguminosarum]MBB4331652.1 hypothetical protein [Rhizobium leguminosarum]MBB4357069.1 hypothetical protein [Rhizobium leguminosarum]MBB4551629.1 hypothetical protein [Rhizobium leguminosarum]MBB4564222.1 hypothetical protein [Rhizobium leguminosarum]TBZ57187.1 hypothetical protein E0H48_17195 [Rhizobium leguminosarum bv. viciae]
MVATPNMIAERTQILPTLETRLTLEATGESTLGRRMASSFLSSCANASKNIGWPSTSPPSSLRQFPPTHYRPWRSPFNPALAFMLLATCLQGPVAELGKALSRFKSLRVLLLTNVGDLQESGILPSVFYLILFGTFVAPMRLRRG